MDEYINREAARPDAFCSGVSCPDCPFLKSPLYGGCRIDDFIASIPAADVVERKHGKWYGEADGYADGELVYDMWSCPFCGKRFEEWDDEPTWNFCPNCGADMRGENDDT